MQSSSSQPSAFFAYAGKPPLRAEAMRDAIVELRSYGVRATGWEDLPVAGNLLVTAICSAINGCGAVVAEVSSMNPNVLFEAGYAIAKNKSVFFMIDETDTDAQKLWTGLEMIATIGRIDYGGNSRTAAEKIAKALIESDPLLQQLLADVKAREANAVFSPTVPHRFNAADRLDRALERKKGLKLLGHGDDLGYAPLAYYASEVYRSSAAVFHLMGPTRQRSPEHNARVSLLAGMAFGWDLPTLMVAEDGFASPLDYRDMLYVYSNTSELLRKVDQWLETVPPAPTTHRRLGQLHLEVELPIRSFGQFVAESEAGELDRYFIATNEFEAVLSARAQIFTGRKGTGKTATMLQSVEQLKLDRRNLVVPIKPTSYDLASLLEILRQVGRGATLDYLLVNLWTYLVLTEIAQRALAHAESLPAGLGGSAEIAALSAVMNDLRIARDADVATRLDEIVAEASGRVDELADVLHVRWQQRLQSSLMGVLKSYDRVAVVIDNLDKTWERGQDFEMLSQFLLSLLVTAGKLENSLGRVRRGSPPPRLTLAVFLRTDIYDFITLYAREPDKISPQSVQWQDEELLIRVLEERYEANRRDRAAAPTNNMWEEVFCSEVNGLPARDYLLWRALPRPRDIIFLANAALTTAINRRHNLVESSDIVFAEKEYSRFAVEALLVETEAQGLDLEEAMYEFAGSNSTIEEGDLMTSLASAGDPQKLRDWLIRTSFLGLETSQGAFVHIEGESEARRKLIAAQRVAQTQCRAVRYRVHPAFRPHLDVRDDDIHNPVIVDVTLHAPDGAG